MCDSGPGLRARRSPAPAALPRAFRASQGRWALCHPCLFAELGGLYGAQKRGDGCAFSPPPSPCSLRLFPAWERARPGFSRYRQRLRAVGAFPMAWPPHGLGPAFHSAHKGSPLSQALFVSSNDLMQARVADWVGRGRGPLGESCGSRRCGCRKASVSLSSEYLPADSLGSERKAEGAYCRGRCQPGSWLLLGQPLGTGAPALGKVGRLVGGLSVGEWRGPSLRMLRVS